MSDILSDAAENLSEVQDTVTNTVSSKTKRFPAIHKFVNKRNLIIVQGGLVVLAIFSIAIVGQVRAERADKANAVAAAAAQADKEAEAKATITRLEARITALETDKTSLCNNYTTLSTARATRSYVIVPSACTIKR